MMISMGHKEAVAVCEGPLKGRLWVLRRNCEVWMAERNCEKRGIHKE